MALGKARGGSAAEGQHGLLLGGIGTQDPECRKATDMARIGLGSSQVTVAELFLRGLGLAVTLAGI